MLSVGLPHSISLPRAQLLATEVYPHTVPSPYHNARSNNEPFIHYKPQSHGLRKHQRRTGHSLSSRYDTKLAPLAETGTLPQALLVADAQTPMSPARCHINSAVLKDSRSKTQHRTHIRCMELSTIVEEDE